jgi:hypothetical protein
MKIGNPFANSVQLFVLQIDITSCMAWILLLRTSVDFLRILALPRGFFEGEPRCNTIELIHLTNS